MPQYKVTLTKEFTAITGTQPWTNGYHVIAADEDAALAIGESIAALEAAIMWENCLVTKIAARQESELAGSGRQEAVAIVGEREVTDEQFLPLFCAVRVTLTDGIARPDQKYLRLPIAEEEQNNGALSSGLIAFIVENYIAPLGAISGVVSSDGAPYTSGVVNPSVQMRQRGWSRRSRPGFKRGYVPV